MFYLCYQLYAEIFCLSIHIYLHKPLLSYNVTIACYYCYNYLTSQKIFLKKYCILLAWGLLYLNFTKFSQEKRIIHPDPTQFFVPFPVFVWLFVPVFVGLFPIIRGFSVCLQTIDCVRSCFCV